MLSVQRFKTTKALVKFFRSQGFFVYAHSKNMLTLSVHAINKHVDIFNLDTEEITLTGETAQELYNQYATWITDKTRWVEKGKVAIIENHLNMFDFDLESEILGLGFKYVEVAHEDSNFVEVMCKFCYIDETGKFKFDGELYIDDIGDKFQTVEYLKQWVMDNEHYQPTLNRVR